MLRHTLFWCRNLVWAFADISVPGLPRNRAARAIQQELLPPLDMPAMPSRFACLPSASGLQAAIHFSNHASPPGFHGHLRFPQTIGTSHGTLHTISHLHCCTSSHLTHTPGRAGRMVRFIVDISFLSPRGAAAGLVHAPPPPQHCFTHAHCWLVARGPTTPHPTYPAAFSLPFAYRFRSTGIPPGVALRWPFPACAHSSPPWARCRPLPYTRPTGGGHLTADGIATSSA